MQTLETVGQRYTKHPMKTATPTRVCTQCGEDKPLTEYYVYYTRPGNPTFSKCKPCWIKAHLERRRAKLKKIRPPKPANCDCCGKPWKTKRNGATTACYDHDHETGKFRGWVCNNCNSGIGLLGDNLEGVENAVRYLKDATN